MAYRETSSYTVFETEPGQLLDLQIAIGKSVSQIAAGEPDVIYRQNGLYAGQDTDGTWFPIGDVVKDGQLVQQGYGVMANWAYLVVPKSGRPYVGYIDPDDFPGVLLAFQTSPMLRKNGKTDIRSVQEQTAPDIAQRAALRSAIGVKADGTIVLVTTRVGMTLNQLEALMASLGCEDALNMDGGGSVSKNYKNEPYGAERKISSALIVRQKAGNAKMAKKVVIDPGHGAQDPGGVGNGMQEKDLVLTIAHKVAWYLQQYYEVDVTMTRTDDTFVELNKRDDIADNIPADFFVSIHCNAYDGKARGFESFVYPGHRGKQAGRMQDVIHNALAAYLKSRGMPDRGKQEKDLSVLRETDMPAVLLEYGFVDEADDAKLLQDPNFIESVSKITADSIAQAMELPAKQTQPEPPAPPTTGVPDWKQKIHDLARQNGLLDSDWSAKLDEPAPVWMVMKLALVAKGVKID